MAEAKPQKQTETQDAEADAQVLEYAQAALSEDKDQKMVYALRLVGVNLMAYKVTQIERPLEPILDDYLDPKLHPTELRNLVNHIKSTNFC